MSGSDPQIKQETRFQGVPVAPGIAHARVVVHWLDDEEIPFRTISAEELPEEIARFESALIATRAELLEIQQRIADAIGTKDAGIFDAHLLVVEDRTLIDEVLRNLENERHNVEYTFHQVAEKYCRTLGAIDDPYLRERVVDIEDVARRVIRHMLGKAPRTRGVRRQAAHHRRAESYPFRHGIHQPRVRSGLCDRTGKQDLAHRDHGALDGYPGHRWPPRTLRGDLQW